jgi:exonuclease III
VGDFSTPNSPIKRSSRYNLNREIMKPTNIMNQMDLTDIFRIFHPNTNEFIFFSASHRYFSKIDHIVGHKASFKRYKKIEITDL